MSLWPQFLKRKKIETPQQLADFIALEADVLTQRTILNYTQALLGRQWKKLTETAEAPKAAHRLVRRPPARGADLHNRHVRTAGHVRRGLRNDRAAACLG
jgi:hypothetical protein